jgi:predicted DNA-binding transcriptional regulator YafY
MSVPTRRAIELLRLVPRAPRSIHAGRLQELLAGMSLPTSSRQIQRMLAELSRHYPLVCLGEDKPYRWCWAEDAVPPVLPSLDLPTALLLVLADEHLGALLPAALRKQSAPLLSAARRALAELPARLDRRLRALGRGPRLKAPPIDPGVFACVSDALAQGRRLRLVVLQRASEQTETLLASPLALLSRAERLYLVVRKRDGRVAHYALHRVREASVSTEASDDRGFDLDAYIDGGAFEFPLPRGAFRLRMRVERRAAPAIVDSPLSETQTLRTLPGGDVEVEAEVLDSNTLRAFLLGFGAAAEVLGPEDFREEFAAEVEGMRGRYGGSGGWGRAGR